MKFELDTSHLRVPLVGEHREVKLGGPLPLKSSLCLLDALLLIAAHPAAS